MATIAGMGAGSSPPPSVDGGYICMQIDYTAEPGILRTPQTLCPRMKKQRRREWKWPGPVLSTHPSVYPAVDLEVDRSGGRRRRWLVPTCLSPPEMLAKGHECGIRCYREINPHAHVLCTAAASQKGIFLFFFCFFFSASHDNCIAPPAIHAIRCYK